MRSWKGKYTVLGEPAGCPRHLDSLPSSNSPLTRASRTPGYRAQASDTHLPSKKGCCSPTTLLQKVSAVCCSSSTVCVLVSTLKKVLCVPVVTLTLPKEQKLEQLQASHSEFHQFTLLHVQKNIIPRHGKRLREKVRPDTEQDV